MDSISNRISLQHLLEIRSKLNKKVKDKYPNLINNIYLVCLAVYIFSTFIKSTDMPGYVFSQHDIYLFALIPSAIVLFKIVLFDNNSINDLIIFALLECVLFAMGQNAANFNIFYFGILIYGAKNVDYDKIIKVFLFVNIVGTFISMALAFGGIIPNYKGTRSDTSPVIRFAFGAIYPTNLAARMLSIIMAYAALRKFKLNLPEYISLIAITIWTYISTDTRLDLALMALLIMVVMCYKPISKVMEKISFKLINIICFGYIGIILLLGFLYKFIPHNAIMQIFNKLLSGRLAYEAEAISEFKLAFLGQYIPQPGAGLFYIDSIYFRIPLMYGIPLIFIFILIVFALNKILHVKPIFYLELCFLLFIISGGIDQHFWESCYNFIILALFAKVPNANQIKREKCIFNEN
nr:hypothetical protein [uncultured Ligilactobacillus sp.]